MSDRIEPRIPVDREGELSGLGLRKSSGAYYTPPGVVDLLLRVSLDPLLEERVQLGIDAVSAVRILDPSCGTGHFLVAAFDRVRRFGGVRVVDGRRGRARRPFGDRCRQR